MEISPSEQFLKALLETLDGMDADELAGELTNAGFVYALSGTLTGDIIRWAAEQMALVIGAGDVAEVAAPVPGEVGRAEAVSARDSIYEEPVEWLRNLAREVDEHRLPNREEHTGEHNVTSS